MDQVTSSRSSITQKTLYGSAFCLLLPALIFVWCRSMPVSALPVIPDYHLLAWAVVVLSAMLIGGGMLHLWTRGKGLPMNAFPPTHYVSNGWYGLFKHPIYVGASLLTFGLGLLFQHPFVFWIAGPLVSMSSLALVWGFERAHIRALYETSHAPFWSLPAQTDEKPSWRDRLRVYAMLYIPWIALYEVAVIWGKGSGGYDTRLPFEQFQVIENFEWIYMTIYPLLAIWPLLLRTKRAIHEWILHGWWMMLIGFLIMYSFPFYCSQLPFEATSLPGEMLTFERIKDSTYGAFPSFHVLWALLVARFSGTSNMVRFLGGLYATALTASCYFTGMHAIIDITGAWIVMLLVMNHRYITSAIMKRTERLANSWREWHWGGMRIISHAWFSGGAAALGLLVAIFFVPNPWYILGITLFSIVCAGLWGQWVEGSSAMLRPFGYYGSIIGALLGTFWTAWVLQINAWVVLSVFAMGAPFVQGFGRLRCLVQGCCHGKRTQSFNGIVVSHPQSRVCGISHLRNQPIHNTQLYSILVNIISICVLMRLWWMMVPATWLVGVYLIINGLGRFVEEAYRGEVQTKRMAGLRIYQWAALISVLLGAVIMLFKAPPLERGPFIGWSTTILIPLIGGVFAAFVMSVDFPKSNRRFSRLTG